MHTHRVNVHRTCVPAPQYKNKKRKEGRTKERKRKESLGQILSSEHDLFAKESGLGVSLLTTGGVREGLERMGTGS